MITLTEEQIQTLFTFTEKKFVKWYDLQVELVDHLANKIEELMNEDNSLTFESALGNVYEKFGLSGFAHIVQEKEKELRKSNNRFLWAEIKNQFRWPNILRSLAVLIIISMAMVTIDLRIAASIFTVSYCVVLTFYIIKKYKATKNQKKILMTQILPSFSGGIFVYSQFIFLRIVASFFIEPILYTDIHKLTFSVLLFIGFIVLFATKNIETRVIKKAKTLYPKEFS